MKTCLVCGRAAADSLATCAHCGSRLPERPAASRAEVAGHAEYVLQQLDEWVAERWVTESQAHKLRRVYESRRMEAMFDAATPLAVAQPMVTTATEAKRSPYDSSFTDLADADPLSAVDGTGTAAPRPNALSAFAEESNLTYWHVIGAIMLVAGLMSSVALAWHSGHKPMLVGLLTAISAGLWGFSMPRAVRDQPITATTFRALSAAVVPLIVIAATAHRWFGHHLGLDTMGMAATAVCLPVYGAAAILQKPRVFTALLITDIILAAHFFLQVVTPGLIHTHDSTMVLSVYGAVYELVALAFLTVGHLTKNDEKRGVWTIAANALALAAIIVAIATTSGGLAANLPLTLGLATVFCLLNASWRGVTPYATGACVLAVIAACAAISEAGYSVGRYWYLYLFTASAFAWGFRWLETRLSSRTPQVADAYKAGSKVVAVIAAAGLVLATAVMLLGFPSLKATTVVELWGMFISGAVLLLYAWRIVSPALIESGAAYLVTILGLLFARYAPSIPVIGQPNIALWLGVTAAAFLGMGRRRQTGIVMTAIALVLCAVYSLIGGFFETSALAFLVLVVAIAFDLYRVHGSGSDVRIEPGDDALEVWLSLAAASAAMILIESRLLPYLHLHTGLEPNSGYGLAMVAAISVGIAASWKAAGKPEGAYRPLSIGGQLIVAIVVLQQLWYSAHGLIWSPLVLVLIGRIVCAVVAIRNKSERAADLTVAMALAAYFIWLIHPHHSHASEQGVALSLLFSAALLAAVATVQRRAQIGYAALVAFLAGYAYSVHSFAHLSIHNDALAFWPAVAVLYFIGYRLNHSNANTWRSAITGMALLAAVFGLGLAGYAMLAPRTAGGELSILAACGSYAVLFGIMAWAEEEAAYIYPLALSVSLAYGYALTGIRPAIAIPEISFLFSLSGIAWYALATAMSRYNDLRRSLTVTVLAVASIACVIALVGVGDSGEHYGLYTVLVAGTLLIGNALMTRTAGWGNAGLLVYAFAFAAFLIQRLGAKSVLLSDYTLIPVGVFALATGILAHRRIRDFQGQAYCIAGLLLGLTPPTLAVWHSHSTLGAAGLVTVCVAAIFYGLSCRARAFVIVPTLYLALLLVIEASGSASGASWAIYATVLGVIVIASALVLERRKSSERTQPAPPSDPYL